MTPEAMLRSILSRPNLTARDEAQAAKYLKMVLGNVIPPLGKIKALYKAMEQAPSCKRLREDGTCLWLRRHASEVGLRQPLPGEIVYCTRKNAKTAKEHFEGCKGYLKEESDG